MMGSGLKYVHALKRGTGAMQGDLEKCRQQASTRTHSPLGMMVKKNRSDCDSDVRTPRHVLISLWCVV